MKLLLLFLSALALVIPAIPPASSSPVHDKFAKCISAHHKEGYPGSPFQTVFCPESSLFSSLLESKVQNMRYINSTSKPLLILTPSNEAEIQAALLCSKQQGLEIRVRSGGHDYQGMSYLSDKPFIIIDLFNLNKVQIDHKAETAWVQTGALLGQLYYEIAKQSTHLAFPAGLCPTVGVGGHLSGGGFGTLVRKYGLAADNVIDAYIVDARGRILNRKSMGEEVFWAIRGSGAASFGIVLSWKVKLVRVPQKLTFFTVSKTLEEGANKLVHKWQQFAHDAHKDLYVRVVIVNVDSNKTKKEKKTVQASFQSLFLGTIDRLIPLMNKSFPELGLRKENCTEGSWADSALYFAGSKPGSPLEVLLNKTQMFKAKFKAKSDFVTKPIPELGLDGIWKIAMEEDAPIIVLQPFGGKMNEIPANYTPYPHRKGNLYNIQYLVNWIDGGVEEEKKHLEWMKKLYDYMEPYVSKSPRAAYVNYRDLDLGTSNGVGGDDELSFSKARVWGEKYFKGNFKRLSKAKSKFDPDDFFKSEQGIPLFRKVKMM